MTVILYGGGGGYPECSVWLLLLLLRLLVVPGLKGHGVGGSGCPKCLSPCKGFWPASKLSVCFE